MSAAAWTTDALLTGWGLGAAAGLGHRWHARRTGRSMASAARGTAPRRALAHTVAAVVCVAVAALDARPVGRWPAWIALAAVAWRVVHVAIRGPRLVAELRAEPGRPGVRAGLVVGADAASLVLLAAVVLRAGAGGLPSWDELAHAAHAVYQTPAVLLAGRHGPTPLTAFLGLTGAAHWLVVVRLLVRHRDFARTDDDERAVALHLARAGDTAAARALLTARAERGHDEPEDRVASACVAVAEGRFAAAIAIMPPGGPDGALTAVDRSFVRIGDWACQVPLSRPDRVRLARVAIQVGVADHLVSATVSSALGLRQLAPDDVRPLADEAQAGPLTRAAVAMAAGDHEAARRELVRIRPDQPDALLWMPLLAARLAIDESAAAATSNEGREAVLRAAVARHVAHFPRSLEGVSGIGRRRAAALLHELRPATEALAPSLLVRLDAAEAGLRATMPLPQPLPLGAAAPAAHEVTEAWLGRAA